jgi:hypothetical protein
MKIGHIRMMAIDCGIGAPLVRIDTLLPKEIKVSYFKKRQHHKPIGSPDDVSSAIHALNEDLKSFGINVSDCTAPEMLPSCIEPPADMAKAFQAAMA